MVDRVDDEASAGDPRAHVLPAQTREEGADRPLKQQDAALAHDAIAHEALLQRHFQGLRTAPASRDIQAASSFRWHGRAVIGCTGPQHEKRTEG